jgi:hypothetical protein
MKKPTFLFLLLLSACLASAQPPAPLTKADLDGLYTQVQDLQQDLRTQVQGLQHNIRDQDLDLKGRILALEAAEGQRYLTWGGLLLALLIAGVSGPLAVAIRARNDGKRLAELAAAKTQEAMNKTWPTMATQLMQAYLDRELPARVNALVDVAKEKDQQDALKQSMSLLVIAETESLAQSRQAKLRDIGFKDVRCSPPHPIAELHGYEVILVDMLDSGQQYNHLDRAYIETLVAHLEKNPQLGFFMLYPGRYENLDFTRVTNKNFANSESQLEENFLRLLKQVHKSQSSTPSR